MKRCDCEWALIPILVFTATTFVIALITLAIVESML